MNSKLKMALKIVSDMLVVAAVVLAVLLHGLQFFGLKPYTVLSGSMQSVYPTGSLIYITDVEPETLEVNDVITFKMSGGAIATHRIVELVPDESNPDIIRFRTKGDENEVVDGSLVDYSSVVGTPVFCIPNLGYLATYITRPPGKYVAATVAIVLIIVEIMISIVLEDKDKKKAKAEKN